MTYVLHVADMPYSSWSLRGWLCLHAFGLPFETRLRRLYDADMDAYRAAMSPARTVPALSWDEGGATVMVWDSLAIAETLAERHPDAGHWPAGAAARAAARSLAAEMHSGFGPLRAAAPMNTRRRALPPRAPLSEAVIADLARLESLWGWALDRWGGPWLGGSRFSVADAFFAPVAFRVAGYDLPVGTRARGYVDALLDHPSVVGWTAAAAADPRVVERYEQY